MKKLEEERKRKGGKNCDEKGKGKRLKGKINMPAAKRPTLQLASQVNVRTSTSQSHRELAQSDEDNRQGGSLHKNRQGKNFNIYSSDGEDEPAKKIEPTVKSILGPFFIYSQYEYLMLMDYKSYRWRLSHFPCAGGTDQRAVGQTS